MKATYFYLVFFILVTSCSKGVIETKEIIIEGKLLTDCNTPAANRKGYFEYSAGMRKVTWAEFTTDENGYFKIIRQNDGSHFGRLMKFRTAGLEVTVPVFGKDHINYGDIYIAPYPTNFIINLDVKKPYTENDTLILLDFWSENPFAQHPPSQVKFPGPFSTTTLDSVINHPYTRRSFSWISFGYGKTPEYSITSIIKTGDSGHVSKSTTFNLALICSGEFSEVTLVID